MTSNSTTAASSFTTLAAYLQSEYGPGMPTWGGYVSWIVVVTIKDGALREFTALTAEMVATAQTESGVLAYLRFVSMDGRLAFLFERYESSKAALEHLQRFHEQYAARYSALIERREFMIFGDASTELLRKLDAYGAVPMRRLSGFGAGTAS